ncbi:MAG TPA: hypothetical protein VFZ34_19970 [Blastocatellia bacterium]|nr:hypothetical protein [Blastocatellia bacterium]
MFEAITTVKSIPNALTIFHLGGYMKRSSLVKKIMAWMMIISLSQVFVLANEPELISKANVKNEAVPMVASAEVPLGRLMADGPVTINGVKAHTGDTVFPGAQIQTVAGIGASIQIGNLGQLDISPNSDLVLNYDRGSIRSEINSGCAVLATSDGIQGLLTMPNGMTKKNDPLKGSKMSACSDSNASAADLSGAMSVRMGAGNLSLGAGSVGFAEFSSMMFSSGAMFSGLGALGNQPVATAAAAYPGGGCCCCCCCCNPSPSAPCKW